MRKLFTFLLLLMLLTSSVSADDTQNIPEYLQSITVKIITPTSNGSGLVFTRKDSTGTNDISFVWSVGHLFEEEITEIIAIQPKSPFELFDINRIMVMTHPLFTNQIIIPCAIITQEILGGGTIIGTNVATIKLLQYSATDKDDITLSLLQTNFFNKNTLKFDLSGRIPRLGDHVYNSSYPHGEYSFSEGNYSFIGIKVNNYTYDQTTCVVYVGSSGGGFFNTNGLCVGLTDMKSAPSINYMIPVRRIITWAKEHSVGWAVDPSIPIPPRNVLEKLVPTSN